MWNTGRMGLGKGEHFQEMDAPILIYPEVLHVVIPNSAVVAMAYYGEVGYSNIPLFHHSNWCMRHPQGWTKAWVFGPGSL
jgi:hypothetical protein